jgi:hypothetical protein
MQVVDRLHSHGIAFAGCFVFGLTMTARRLLKTAEFAAEDRPAAKQWSASVPLWRLDAEAILQNWGCTTRSMVFQPRHMSIEELQNGIESAWKHAYSYHSIWRRVRSSPAPWPVRLGTNLGYRFYANNLSRFYNCDWIIGRVPRNTPVPDESETASIAS